MVGFSEEITYRGLAVVGFRGGYSEVHVWLFTSILFGLLHGVNFFLGQDAVPTLRQVIFAFVLGSVFYSHPPHHRHHRSSPWSSTRSWDFGSFSPRRR